MYVVHAISIRYLREHLAAVLRKVSKGEQLVIMRLGKPVARIVPEQCKEVSRFSKYPLRGSVRRLARDFDKPLDGLWKALR